MILEVWSSLAKNSVHLYSASGLRHMMFKLSGIGSTSECSPLLYTSLIEFASCVMWSRTVHVCCNSWGLLLLSWQSIIEISRPSARCIFCSASMAFFPISFQWALLSDIRSYFERSFSILPISLLSMFSFHSRLFDSVIAQPTSMSFVIRIRG